MNTERICAVISELLPLYSEGMLGEEAKAFVEEHISGCSKCSQELADFSRKTMLPITSNESSAYKAAKKRRNTLIIIISVIAAFSLLASSVLFTAAVYANSDYIKERSVLFTAAVYANSDYIKELPQRMYMGDRLTLNVMAKSDGQSVELTEKNVACIFDEAPEHDLPVNYKRIEYFNQQFSIAGGKYGGYTFTIQSGDNIIKAGIHNTNWWNVANINLIYDIDTENHTMSYIFYDQSGVISAEEDGKTYVLGAMV